MLLERLPGGRVVALDGSPSMLDQARRRLERFGDRVEFVHADLRGPLSPAIPEPVDAVLSTATFHWIHDHAALYRHLAEVVRPDGRLVAQYGGAGNTASVRAVLATIGDGWTGDVFFAEPTRPAAGLRTPAGMTSRHGSSPSRPASSRASRSRHSCGP